MDEMSKEEMEEVIRLAGAFEPNHPIGLLLNGFLDMKMEQGTEELTRHKPGSN